MLRDYCLGVVILAFCTACSTSDANVTDKRSSTLVEGSEAWFVWVDRQVVSADTMGHGPDLGSAEWCGVIEAKLFNRASGLEPCSTAWNSKATQKLQAKK
ncbi:hypothetical protein [Entomomonas asaccharolytica]|uniref:Uncharacterized protein n=1 Tax=Entomomonas asaccharolytica TaxID=2785331 RepID=A0A974RZ29_9GAMM|nr:hypothetical protein [Entomomonas asaccharolytica]QQP86614.1 hypothetical protein JHT90_05080 [Entomomonas asaccharolytica]